MENNDSIYQELRYLRERVQKLEESRTADVISVRELALQVKELESKIDAVSQSNRALTSNVESLRVDFQELYRGLTRLSMKVAEVDERSKQHEKQNAERYQTIQNQMEQVNENLSKLTGGVERIAPRVTDPKPWYVDATKLKEIAAALALLITMVMGMVNAQKIDQLPPPKEQPPVQVDINTNSTGK